LRCCLILHLSQLDAATAVAAADGAAGGGAAVAAAATCAQALAMHGEVSVSSQEVAQRIGQVFLQRSAVNLLSSVLDTPEFFWSAPDHLQVRLQHGCVQADLPCKFAVYVHARRCWMAMKFSSLWYAALDALAVSVQ
jgi:hypothetical protein